MPTTSSPASNRVWLVSVSPRNPTTPNPLNCVALTLSPVKSSRLPVCPAAACPARTRNVTTSGHSDRRHSYDALSRCPRTPVADWTRHGPSRGEPNLPAADASEERSRRTVITAYAAATGMPLVHDMQFNLKRNYIGGATHPNVNRASGTWRWHRERPDIPVISASRSASPDWILPGPLFALASIPRMARSHMSRIEPT